MNKQILSICFLLFSLNSIGFCQPNLSISDKDLYSRDSINGIYIPKDLNECLTQIDILWYDDMNASVKTLTEEEFIAQAHSNNGRWIRHNWGMCCGSRLQVYFNDKGIHDPNDMSDIVFASYHRHLSNKKIKLKKQINQYKERLKISLLSSRFEAKTKGNRIYTNIKTALVHSDSITDIRMIGYTQWPKKMSKFNRLNKLTIENCPYLDFSNTFKLCESFDNLTELCLYENKRNHYPASLGAISNLNLLWLTELSLTQLPKEIKSLNSLNKLVLTDCPNLRLDTLFSLLAEIETLTELDLSGNQLTDIPGNISALTQLTDLRLNQNQLKGIPHGVKSLPRLENISLFRNKIDNLDLGPKDWPSLKSINVSHNKFKFFPIDLSYLNKLERIIMSYNTISVIPDEVTNFKGLKYLNLHNNRLSDEQKDVIRTLLTNTELKL